MLDKMPDTPAAVGDFSAIDDHRHHHHDHHHNQKSDEKHFEIEIQRDTRNDTGPTSIHGNQSIKRPLSTSQPIARSSLAFSGAV